MLSIRRVLTVPALLVLAAANAAAQSPPAAPDSLLERLVGAWRMEGTVRGRPVAYTLDVTRVLQGRFVELHMTDVTQPPAYEARVFVGADTAAGRVIAHWMDSFGAAYSVPPGTGTARGDTLWIDFPYPDGTFHDTFAFDRRDGTWRIILDAADGHGGWRRFAEYVARRR